MFKKILSPNARETRRDFLRRTATHAGRTSSVPNALVASVERVSDVRLAYVEFHYFFNTPGARFTYTLMCDCSLTLLFCIELRFHGNNITGKFFHLLISRRFVLSCYSLWYVYSSGKTKDSYEMPAQHTCTYKL